MSLDIDEYSVRERKRKQFTGNAGAPPSRAGRLIAGIAAVALLAGIGTWFWVRGSPDNSPAVAAPTPAQGTVAAQDGAFRIPLADLASGEAKFFEHKVAGGQPIRFFAVKGADGTHRAALDACEICYAGRKGYQQNGTEMLCRKCGLSFPSEVIDDVKGGCHPIRIERAVEGDTLVVRIADVEKADAPHAAAAASGRMGANVPPTLRRSGGTQ